MVTNRSEITFLQTSFLKQKVYNTVYKPWSIGNLYMYFNVNNSVDPVEKSNFA